MANTLFPKGDSMTTLQQPAPTFDDVWRLMQETSLQIKETGLQMKETDRKFQETDRKFQETERVMKERSADLDQRFQPIFLS
jgi:hypothetical protein